MFELLGELFGALIFELLGGLGLMIFSELLCELLGELLNELSRRGLPAGCFWAPSARS